MDWIDDVFLQYVMFGGLTLNAFIMDKVADNLGEFAAFVVMFILLPITLFLVFVGIVVGSLAVIAAVLFSPIIFPFTIYRHLKS